MATGETHGGKGSTARPVNKSKFDQNFDAIFRKKFNEMMEEKKNESKTKKDVRS